MKLRLVLMLAFVLAAAAASAQPFPGAVLVNGGWVPCDHPIAIAAGKSRVPSPGVAPTPAPTPDPTPYGSGGHQDLGTRFELGKTYESPYGFRVTIIGTVRKTDGSYVFVGEIIRSGGFPQVGDLLNFPVDKDRGPFQFEVPPEEIGTASIF
jgi:opacity protein-like surface antigen